MIYIIKKFKIFIKKIYTKFLILSYNPYKLKYQILSPREVSDFFIWSGNFKNYFIAENTNALLKGIKEKVTHKFFFYSPDGILIKEYEFQTINYFEKIELPLFNKYEYISFIHFKYSNKTFKNSLSKKNIFRDLRVAPQSRGYSLYQKNNSNISAVAHGNFGGIAKNGIKTATQRDSFIFTTVYNFEKESLYNLVFNNPTSKLLNIKIKFFNNKSDIKLCIPPMGTKHISVKNYSGGISYESRLPITRPLIFKNPPPQNKDFDVFHG